jgi:hypothetical protein
MLRVLPEAPFAVAHMLDERAEHKIQWMKMTAKIMSNVGYKSLFTGKRKTNDLWLQSYKV